MTPILKEYLGTPTLIKVKGVEPYYLNGDLARRKRLSAESFEIIRALHLLKCQITLAMEVTDDPEELHTLAEEFEKFQFMLQLAWGFPQDKSFHPCYLVPKCTCPKMDNREREGTPYQIVSETCPVHGSK